MLLHYVGPKQLPLTLNTPIPYLSKSDHSGTITFNPTCEIENEEWGRFLLEQCGASFVRVDAPVEKAAPTLAPAVNKFAPISDEERAKRFEDRVLTAQERQFKGHNGKWLAKAYLKKYGLHERLGMSAVKVGGQIMFWKLVPSALADVKVGNDNAETPITSTEAGQGVTDEHDDRETVPV